MYLVLSLVIDVMLMVVMRRWRNIPTTYEYRNGVTKNSDDDENQRDKYSTIVDFEYTKKSIDLIKKTREDNKRVRSSNM